ncbi:hypothetical protein HI914_03287 [Erysiphe necator]|nr:hypothetical protein HI914_03287 [Erysiphe necator]
MIAFPPHRTKISNIVSQDVALAHITAYLTSSETQPHLLPNAHLDPSSGPTIRSSNFSVTIHNLRRVQAGLRGEILAPTLELDDINDVASVSQKLINVMNTNELKNGNITIKSARNGEASNSNYIPLSEQTSTPNLDISNSEQTTEHKNKSSLTFIDKEARKREKKIRRKELKKSRKE